MLDEVIASLRNTGGDARSPELRRALGTLDQLRDGLRGTDARAFPEGFAERLTSARLDMNLGDPDAALEALGALRAELEKHSR